MDQTVEPTWDRYDRPVLGAVIRYIEDHHFRLMPQAYDLAPQLDMEAEDVGKALLRLNGEYLKTVAVGGGLSQVLVEKVHSDARRAVGQWPSPEEIAEDLVARLQAAADVEPDPGKRSKLRQTAAFLGSGGKDLLIGVLGSVIANQAGIG
jgi:hypothetical protein